MVTPRAAVQALPAYKPGRNPADLAREIGVDRAVKLASNEVAFPPLPAVVRAHGGFTDVEDHPDLAGRPRYTTARLVSPASPR